MADARYVDWYGKGRYRSWRTPRALFDVLDMKYRFNLDGAADAENGLVPEASTVEHPIPWEGRRVFCNPPWSNIKPFVEQAPTAEVAVLLVPARTNARWFHRALDLGAKPMFFVGKPKFESQDGAAPFNSPVDCLFLVWE